MALEGAQERLQPSWRLEPSSKRSPRPYPAKNQCISKSLLGLLGTISGMITVFQVISTQTVVDPPSLAGGISEALYTTAFGLIVAIPTFIGYKFINNKVLEISNKLQTESDKLINELRKISEPK